MKSSFSRRIFLLFTAFLVFYIPLGLSQTPSNIATIANPNLRKLSVPIPNNISTFEHIRINILHDQTHFILTVWDPYEIQPLNATTVLKKGWELRQVNVEAVSGGIRVGNDLLATDSFKIVTKKEVEIGKRKYKGSIEVRKTPAGKFLVINEIGLEDYLKGVLPKEVSSRWPMEALKAQAVASRTYALFHILTRANQDYALESTVLGQVYGGSGSELPQTNYAVDSTRGEILTYKGEIFKAYFHATCGGHTTRADSVWDVEPFPPLMGVACAYDVASKHYYWTTKTQWDELTKRLQKAGYKVGRVLSIEPQNIDESKRALSFKVKHTLGTSIFNSNDFRLAVGPELIRSTRFEVRHEGDEAIFKGIGWGHGVGLCQWGAKGMGEKGFTYLQILQHYYPGSEITKT